MKYGLSENQVHRIIEREQEQALTIGAIKAMLNLLEEQKNNLHHDVMDMKAENTKKDDSTY